MAWELESQEGLKPLRRLRGRCGWCLPLESQEGLKQYSTQPRGGQAHAFPLESQEGLKPVVEQCDYHLHVCAELESQEGLKRSGFSQRGASCTGATLESQEGLKQVFAGLRGYRCSYLEISRRVETQRPRVATPSVYHQLESQEGLKQ